MVVAKMTTRKIPIPFSLSTFIECEEPTATKTSPAQLNVLGKKTVKPFFGKKREEEVYVCFKKRIKAKKSKQKEMVSDKFTSVEDLFEFYYEFDKFI